jgi:hypothetical protein
MNKPILCCFKIKSATLLIGIFDLMMHMLILATLFASISSPNAFENVWSHSEINSEVIMHNGVNSMNINTETNNQANELRSKLLTSSPIVASHTPEQIKLLHSATPPASGADTISSSPSTRYSANTYLQTQHNVDFKIPNDYLMFNSIYTSNRRNFNTLDNLN